MLSTYLAVKKSLKEVPAELLRPKSPKAGKRVLLERIPLYGIVYHFKKSNSKKCI